MQLNKEKVEQCKDAENIADIGRKILKKLTKCVSSNKSLQTIALLHNKIDVIAPNVFEHKYPKL